MEELQRDLKETRKRLGFGLMVLGAAVATYGAMNWKDLSDAGEKYPGRQIFLTTAGLIAAGEGLSLFRLHYTQEEGFGAEVK